MKKEKKLILLCILIISLVALMLYFNPLFSNKPLGLDALGHVSKISYLKEFGLNVNWDLAWYNGAPFLAYYSPLYYHSKPSSSCYHSSKEAVHMLLCLIVLSIRPYEMLHCI